MRLAVDAVSSTEGTGYGCCFRKPVLLILGELLQVFSGTHASRAPVHLVASAMRCRCNSPCCLPGGQAYGGPAAAAFDCNAGGEDMAEGKALRSQAGTLGSSLSAPGAIPITTTTHFRRSSTIANNNSKHPHPHPPLPSTSQHKPPPTIPVPFSLLLLSHAHSFHRPSRSRKTCRAA